MVADHQKLHGLLVTNGVHETLYEDLIVHTGSEIADKGALHVGVLLGRNEWCCAV